MSVFLLLNKSPSHGSVASERCIRFVILPHARFRKANGLMKCQSIHAGIPGLVSFPGDTVYEEEQSHYWSVRQADLIPACRLSPTNTQETSELVHYMHQHGTDFAINNGGHSTVLSASNLDTGITLDLSYIASISVAADNTSVKIGTGAHWHDVYRLLDPKGLTVAGARAGSVGAGGFLLGGGISISAPQYGWSCDTLISIEVVLANGSVLDVNQTHHADLSKALKGGGSNFGIATSFTMRVLPFTSLQVAYIRYDGHQIGQLMHEIANFNAKAHEDTKVSLDLSMAFNPISGRTFAFLMMTRFGKISESHVLQPFFDISHSYESLEEATPAALGHNVDHNNPKGYRYAHRRKYKWREAHFVFADSIESL